MAAFLVFQDLLGPFLIHPPQRLEMVWKHTSKTLQWGPQDLRIGPDSLTWPSTVGLDLARLSAPLSRLHLTPALQPQGPPAQGLHDCVLVPPPGSRAFHTPPYLASSFKFQGTRTSSEKPFQTPRTRLGPPDLHYHRNLCSSSEHLYSSSRTHWFRVSPLLDCGSIEACSTKFAKLLDPHGIVLQEGDCWDSGLSSLEGRPKHPSPE